MGDLRFGDGGHVIVCGLHGVCLRTVEQLYRAGVAVTVVAGDDDQRLVDQLLSWGIPLHTGSPRLASTLREAGIDTAAALISALSDDLHTLETALLARELRADLRVVAQIRNPAVGRAMTDVDIAVLDVAGLSAPAVVESCLRTQSHPLELGGQRFQTHTARAPRAGTLRELFGDLAPVAVVAAAGGTAAGGAAVMCPGRDYVVAEGDTVTVLGTPAELVARGLSPPAARGGRSPLRRRHLVASLFSAIDRRLLVVLGCLVTLIMVSTAVLYAGYEEPDGTRMTVLDAVYFAVETVATVGYGDFNFRQQPSHLRVFAIVLMSLGAVTVALFFALLTNLYVSRGIAEALGRRLVTWMSGHVVVVGLGSIGIRVVELLREAGADVVVLDLDEHNRYVAQARALGARVVAADATQPRSLEAVNLGRASAVAVVTSDDLINLETGLAVRDQLGSGWPATPVVLRLFDRQLALTVERNFGFRFVRSTAELAAPWFVGAVLGLDVLGTFYVAHQPVLVGRMTVTAGSGLDGLALGELSTRTRVVTITRATEGHRPYPRPRRDTRLHAGDRVYLIGPYEELLQVLRRDSLPPGGTCTYSAGFKTVPWSANHAVSGQDSD